MFGDNPIRPPEKGDGSSLLVQEMFRTFQGEGVFTGYPSVFIRLGGCNLACIFCDTEFESFEEKNLEEIITQTHILSGESDKNRTHNLVVITGGEPFRQPIEKLCDELINLNYKVQIETNGTLFRNINQEVDIVCSPKQSNGKFYEIRDDLLQRISCFKFLVSKYSTEYSAISEVGQSKYNTPVYVQPMDEVDAEKNKENLELTKKIADENGYRISLQTHKMIGIE